MSNIHTYSKQPLNIEEKSFEIIDDIIKASRPEYSFTNDIQEKIIKRAIHTSADFEWLDILYFSPEIIPKIITALQQGATIYTDTNMALSGINKLRLDQLGCQYHCYVADPATRETAKNQNITRSMAAVERALLEQSPESTTTNKIFIFGNAPTGLFRLLETYQTQPLAQISAVIGVPVGFVGAAESKAALVASELPCIAALGRKGGSNIAAAIINAILYAM